MGEVPIVEGIIQYPSVEALEDSVSELTRAGYLDESEEWLDAGDTTISVAGEKEPVNRAEQTLRIPHGAYRNFNRGLPTLIDGATAGGVVGTMRCRRIGIAAVAGTERRWFTDLQTWGVNHGYVHPPEIEDAGYTEEARDRWFREVANEFVSFHRNTVVGGFKRDTDSLVEAVSVN